MKKHYYTLGIERTAGGEEIEHAFRTLALKYHPSRNGVDQYFIDRYNRICEAYEALRDPARKAACDRQPEESCIEKSAEIVQEDAYRRKFFDQFQEEAIVAEAVLPGNAQSSKSRMPFNSHRSVAIRRMADLTFEDKSWIFLGSALSIGSIGILMSRRFHAEGYARKSRQARLLAILGVAGMILFIILVRYLRAIYVY